MTKEWKDYYLWQRLFRAVSDWKRLGRVFVAAVCTDKSIYSGVKSPTSKGALLWSVVPPTAQASVVRTNHYKIK